jgi:hypothetical protein
VRPVLLLSTTLLLACASSREPCATCDRLPDAAAETDAPGTTDAAVDAAVTPPDAPWQPADPFTLETCTPMAFADLVAYFPAGGTAASVGGFTLTSRTRASCNEITGCSPWVHPSPVRLQQIFARDGYAKGTTHAMPPAGSTQLQLVTSSPAKITMQLAAAEPGAASLTIRFRCEGVPQNGSADGLDCSVQVEFPGDYPSLLWFVDTYAGQPLFDNTTMVSWRGRICDDGRYQLVTRLASDLGTSVEGANNRNQLAIHGTL